MSVFKQNFTFEMFSFWYVTSACHKDLQASIL